MSYEKQVWKDGTTDYTPLTPERLNHMEDGIAAANDAWDSVAPVSGSISPAAPWRDNGSSLEREGRDVELVVNVVTTGSAPQVWDVLITIPESFRPKKELDFAAVAFTTESYPLSAWIAVMPDGTVRVKDYLSGGKVAYQFKAVCRFRT